MGLFQFSDTDIHRFVLVDLFTYMFSLFDCLDYFILPPKWKINRSQKLPFKKDLDPQTRFPLTLRDLAPQLLVGRGPGRDEDVGKARVPGGAQEHRPRAVPCPGGRHVTRSRVVVLG